MGGRLNIRSSIDSALTVFMSTSHGIFRDAIGVTAAVVAAAAVFAVCLLLLLLLPLLPCCCLLLPCCRFAVAVAAPAASAVAAAAAAAAVAAAQCRGTLLQGGHFFDFSKYICICVKDAAVSACFYRDQYC